MKRSVLVLAMLLFLFACTACSGRSYRIEVTSGADKIESIPTHAREGEEVTILTLSVTDADLYVSVDGVVLSEKSYCEYVFVMPDHDVEVKVWIDTSNYDV